jgi:2-keto-3-deoxy-L-rhamnonate aldolase RhmA
MTLRERIAARERVIGTFLKTPAPHGVEILATCGMDFVVADLEHAPLDRASLDLACLAGRACGLPVLVRSIDADAASITPGLDMGCEGVMAPHIRSAAAAESLLDAVRFARGRRGYSPSCRMGNYGTAAATLADDADRRTIAMAQIEDAEALGCLGDIASVEGLDVLFLGPADMARSLDVPANDPAIPDAGDRIAAVARQKGLAAGVFVAHASKVAGWAARGFTVFVVGSDQSLLRSAAILSQRIARE